MFFQSANLWPSYYSVFKHMLQLCYKHTFPFTLSDTPFNEPGRIRRFCHYVIFLFNVCAVFSDNYY